MDTKNNLTPELKEIYERVMGAPLKSPPVESVPSSPSPQKSFTTPTFPYIATVPVIKVETSKLGSSDQMQSQNATQTVPTKKTQSIASLGGETRSSETESSKKPLLIGLSVLLIIIWTSLWAVFFGFIKM